MCPERNDGSVGSTCRRKEYRGEVFNPDEKVMQGQAWSAVEFTPFRQEDRAWAGGLRTAVKC